MGAKYVHKIFKLVSALRVSFTSLITFTVYTFAAAATTSAILAITVDLDYGL